MTKLLFENTIDRIFTQKYNKLKFYQWMKTFYSWIEFLNHTEIKGLSKKKLLQLEILLKIIAFI